MDENLKSEIFIVIYGKREGISLEEFGELFRQVHGYNLNLSNYGYSSLRELFNDMNNLVELKTINGQHMIRCKSHSRHHVVVSHGNHSSQANEMVSGLLNIPLPSPGRSRGPVARKCERGQPTPLQQNHVKQVNNTNSATDKKCKETSKLKCCLPAKITDPEVSHMKNPQSIKWGFLLTEKPGAVHETAISVIKKNIQLLLNQHSNGLSVFQLQKLYLLTFRQPLKYKGSSTVKQLLLHLEDVVKTEGVGVQMLVFPVPADSNSTTAANGDHDAVLQETASLFTKKDFQKETVLNSNSSDSLKTQNDKCPQQMLSNTSSSMVLQDTKPHDLSVLQTENTKHLQLQPRKSKNTMKTCRQTQSPALQPKGDFQTANNCYILENPTPQSSDSLQTEILYVKIKKPSLKHKKCKNRKKVKQDTTSSSNSQKKASKPQIINNVYVFSNVSSNDRPRYVIIKTLQQEVRVSPRTINVRKILDDLFVCFLFYVFFKSLFS